MNGPTRGRRAATARRTAPSTTVDAFALTGAVTRIRRALRASIRSEIPWETLPMAQVEILQRLAEEPGLRVSDIARRHRLAANTVSNLIQAMVTAGLVSRTPDPDDRRAVVLHLTETGAASLAGWEGAHARRIDTALRSLSRRDRDAIAAAIGALTQLAGRLEQTEPAEPSTASPEASTVTRVTP